MATQIQAEASAERRFPLPAGWRTAAGLALGAAVLVALARVVDLGQVSAAFRIVAARPDLLGAFLLAYTAAFALRAAAWRALLATPVGVPRLFSILQAALFANHLLPVKVGEALRPYLAARRGVPAAEAAATTVAARLLDFLSLLIIAAALLPLAAAGPSAGLRALALPAVLLAVAAIALFWLRAASRPPALPGRLGRYSGAARDALRGISGRRAAAAALWTAPSWVLEGVVLLVAARAAGVDLSVQAAVAATAATILFQVFHVTPGGLGVYEASMTGALALYGVPAEQGLVLAALAHGLKFAYSFTVGLAFAAGEAGGLLGLRGLGALRGSAGDVKRASRFEILAARAWNVVNEGKPFTPVFVTAVLLLLSAPRALDPAYWGRAGLAALALLPLFVIFYRFDFPLRLRVALWLYLAAFLLLFRFFDPVAAAVVLALYFAFTVGLWGTVYYHLRIGTPWTNFTRFWRLVLENPDPTSGNFLEQAPKTLLLVLLFRYLVEHPGWGSLAAAEAFILAVGVTAVLVHQWFFTWAPAPPLTPTRVRNTAGHRVSRRVIVIAIDGCRADRLLEARTPCIDRLRREGADFRDVRTVYPARTVTCFSSMLTGAPPRVHGMRSNFVPSLGVKCDSVFTAFRRQGLRAKLVGIAHLVDAFGEEDVETVTAVMNNDEIDHALSAKGKEVLQREDPDLLVLQLLSVDQTGHARGSYHREYLEKIEETDRIVEEFLAWCRREGYLEDATVLITADHGQGIGIGGHGHMSRTEVHVPCILWGKGVPAGLVSHEPRTLMDVAPTVSYFLGALPPEQSVGQVLLAPDAPAAGVAEPVAVIIPAYNEAENLPEVLAAIPRDAAPDLRVLVVDDGSDDGTAEVARRCGADEVLRHERNRGLGAALRTGLERARELNARAAVYLDGDGEYDPRQIPSLLAPVLAGQADYVVGSRYRGNRDGQPWLRFLGNLAFSVGLCVLAGRLITDGQSGFRAFSRRALEVAEIVHDYNYAQVLTLDLLKKGMRYREVPISFRARRRGRSFIRYPEYVRRVLPAVARELLAE
ncbi:MAG TPA: lysylphosphatidylglycerol synthase domain-containing protein [Dehalococcoidia bacterium]